MRRFEIMAAFLCMTIVALLVLISCALDKPAEPEPPKVDTKGLCVVEVKEPEYELYFTEADVTALAQMLYGEARGCTVDNQRKCVWCVLNRVDDPRFPETIVGVVSQSGQFYGYSPHFPVWDELRAVALDVLTRWSMEKQGAAVTRELPDTYCWFTGDGETNHFREAY
jgi:spore germination cell wall hydrolase CwlJ-like protein